jgi:hypothetical protein
MSKRDVAIILALAIAAQLALIYGLLAVRELLRW